MQIDQLMTRNVVTCQPEDNLERAAQLWERDIGAVVVRDGDGRLAGILTDRAVMAANQVRRVPIVDEAGWLVGIVSLNDLARAARSSPSAAINQRGVESTLSSISTPRLEHRAARE